MQFKKYTILVTVLLISLVGTYEALHSPNDTRYRGQYNEVLKKTFQELEQLNLDSAHRDYFKALKYLGGSERDDSKALELAESSARQGLIGAETLTGSLYFEAKNYPLAFQWFKNAAKDLDGYALYMLATKPYEPDFDPINQEVPEWKSWIATKEFADLLHKTAERGDSDGQYILGKWYYEGTNLKKNTQQGVEYLTRSADNYNNMAKYYLGSLYKNGDDAVRPNIAKAIEILGKSTSYASLEQLAGIYATDEKYKDIKKAEDILNNLCENNSALACINLANLLLTNDFEETEGLHDRAFSLFKKAYDLHEPLAAFYLAQMYMGGDVVDKEKGDRLYREVLDSLNPSVAIIKGLMYQKGIFVQKDLEKAKEIFGSLGDKNLLAKKLFEETVDEAFGISKPAAKGKKKRASKGSSSAKPEIEKEQEEPAVEVDIVGDALTKALNGAISYKDKSVITDIESSTGTITIFNPSDKSQVIITLGSLKRITDKDLKELRQFVYDAQKSSKGRTNVAEWLSGDPKILHSHSPKTILRHTFAQRVDELIQLYGEKSFYLTASNVVVKNKRVPGKIIDESGKEYAGFFEYDFYDDPKKGKVLYHRFLHPKSRTYVRSK